MPRRKTPLAMLSAQNVSNNATAGGRPQPEKIKIDLSAEGKIDSSEDKIDDLASKEDHGEESIQVAIRLRPLNMNEVLSKVTWKIADENRIIENVEGKFATESWEYDHVFGEDATTKDVYNAVGKGIVASVCGGKDGVIFAYGQTSSGKTFTMQGSGTIQEGVATDGGGIVHMVARDIFAYVVRTDTGSETTVRVSLLEVYNEVLYDLLSTSGDNRKIDIHQDSARGVFVNAEKVKVDDVDSLLKVLFEGEKSRKMAKTDMNKRSSRSHSVFQITIESQDNGCVQRSSLNLIDLAGSERLRNSGATGDRLKEATHINTSLLTLSRVLKSLGQKRPGYICFRESKLTRLLQPSLSGNARIAMICCATGSEKFHTETLSTLEFAKRAKLVKTKARVNQVKSDRMRIQQLEKENAFLKRALAERQDLPAQQMTKTGDRGDFFAELAEEGRLPDHPLERGLLWRAHESRMSEGSKADGLCTQLKEKLETLENLISESNVTIEKLKSANSRLQQELKISEENKEDELRKVSLRATKKRIRLDTKLRKARVFISHLEESASIANATIVQKDDEIRHLQLSVADYNKRALEAEGRSLEFQQRLSRLEETDKVSDELGSKANRNDNLSIGSIREIAFQSKKQNVKMNSGFFSDSSDDSLLDTPRPLPYCHKPVSTAGTEDEPVLTNDSDKENRFDLGLTRSKPPASKKAQKPRMRSKRLMTKISGPPESQAHRSKTMSIIPEAGQSIAEKRPKTKPPANDSNDKPETLKLPAEKPHKRSKRLLTKFSDAPEAQANRSKAVSILPEAGQSIAEKRPKTKPPANDSNDKPETLKLPAEKPRKRSKRLLTKISGPPEAQANRSKAVSILPEAGQSIAEKRPKTKPPANDSNDNSETLQLPAEKLRKRSKRLLTKISGPPEAQANRSKAVSIIPEAGQSIAEKRPKTKPPANDSNDNSETLQLPAEKLRKRSKRLLTKLSDAPEAQANRSKTVSLLPEAGQSIAQKHPKTKPPANDSNDQPETFQLPAEKLHKRSKRLPGFFSDSSDDSLFDTPRPVPTEDEPVLANSDKQNRFDLGSSRSKPPASKKAQKPLIRSKRLLTKLSDAPEAQTNRSKTVSLLPEAGQSIAEIRPKTKPPANDSSDKPETFKLPAEKPSKHRERLASKIPHSSNDAQRKRPTAKTKPPARQNGRSENKPIFSGTPNEKVNGKPFDWEGWTKKTFRRQSGKSAGQTDSYWYTPVLEKKLRSIREVERFLGHMKNCNNDENEAWKHLKSTSK